MTLWDEEDEPAIYELASWDLPGIRRREHRQSRSQALSCSYAHGLRRRPWKEIHRPR